MHTYKLQSLTHLVSRHLDINIFLTPLISIQPLQDIFYSQGNEIVIVNLEGSIFFSRKNHGLGFQIVLLFVFDIFGGICKSLINIS